MDSRVTIARKETTIRLCITCSGFIHPLCTYSVFAPRSSRLHMPLHLEQKGERVSGFSVPLLQKKKNMYTYIKKVVGNAASLRLRETKDSTWREIR